MDDKRVNGLTQYPDDNAFCLYREESQTELKTQVKRLADAVENVGDKLITHVTNDTRVSLKTHIIVVLSVVAVLSGEQVLKALLHIL